MAGAVDGFGGRTFIGSGRRRILARGRQPGGVDTLAKRVIHGRSAGVDSHGPNRVIVARSPGGRFLAASVILEQEAHEGWEVLMFPGQQDLVIGKLRIVEKEVYGVLIDIG